MDLILVALALVTAAFSAGTVVADWRLRRREVLKLEAAKADLIKTTAEIAEAHNGLAKQVLSLQEQINSHELRLGLTTQKKAPSQWTSAPG